MRGTSLRSLTAVSERFKPVLTAAGEDAVQLGQQLFAVLDALDSSAALVRSLADPSRAAEDKAAVVRQLLADQFDARVVAVVQDVAEQRWVADRDVADAVERLAVDAVLYSAQVRDRLAQVEDELFTIMRALIDSREARQLLSDHSVSAESRVRLLESVLAGRGDEVSRLLAVRAARSPRGRRFNAILGWYGDLAAQMRDRLVAAVTTGTPLSDAQLSRLETVLGQAYGRRIQLNVNVEPAYLAGLRIQVGSEVVDATILSRLIDARRQLAS